MPLVLRLILNACVCCNVYGDCTEEVKGVVRNEVIGKGEFQTVVKGGVAINTTISSEGQQIIYEGGKAINTTIEEFEMQAIYAGGCASKTTIKSGYQAVFKKGKAIDTIVSGKYGQQFVEDGGYASKTTVSDGGVQEGYEGAKVINTTISEGGRQNFYPKAYTKAEAAKVKAKHGASSLVYLPIYAFAIKVKILLSKIFRAVLTKVVLFSKGLQVNTKK
jgi:autotransporter passenger strand-loop-strand repeat protein